MTFDELKDLFMRYRYAEKNLSRLRRAVADIESDIANIGSALANIGMPRNPTTDTATERLIDKLDRVKTKYLEAMEKYLTAEDELTTAFWEADLTEEERDIIIDSYVYRKPAWKIAQERSYSDSTIERRLRRARKKILKK